MAKARPFQPCIACFSQVSGLEWGLIRSAGSVVEADALRWRREQWGRALMQLLVSRLVVFTLVQF